MFIEPPLRRMQPNRTRGKRESSEGLAEAAAGGVEQQGFGGIEAGWKGVAALQTAVGIGGNGQELALAVAGVGVGFGAQMLDHFDGEVELGAAVALEVLGADADGDFGAVGGAGGER